MLGDPVFAFQLPDFQLQAAGQSQILFIGGPQLPGALFDPLLEPGVELLQLGVLALEFEGEPAVALLQVEALQGFADDGLELFVIPGFGDISIDPSFVDGLPGRVDVGIARQHDADGMGRDGLGVAEKLRADHLRHPLVRDDKRHFALAEQLQTSLAAFGGQQLVSLPMEEPAQGIEDAGFVIDEEQRVLIFHII